LFVGKEELWIPLSERTAIVVIIRQMYTKRMKH